MKHRVFDLIVTETQSGFHLRIPIKTGHLQVDVGPGFLDYNIMDFLSTAMKSPTRRLGENPSNE